MQHDRTGFYPVCASDYLEPLRMLRGHLDRLLFCDKKRLPMGRTSHQEIMQIVEKEGLPQPFFLSGDALSAIAILKPVDLFFIRRDTRGEGGSELDLLGPERLPLVLGMIKPGGTLVTDRICGGEWFKEFKTDRISQMEVRGRRLVTACENQPWTEAGLTAFEVK